MSGPLFICHANCCRSVLAYYLYRHLCGDAPAHSAGLDPGEEINDRAEAMLREWGIDPAGHRPGRVSRDLCNHADAIFVMAPSYLHRLLFEYGEEYAGKTYLFADPFSRPLSFAHREYIVRDPSFDTRSTHELVDEFRWMRERVVELHLAVLGKGNRLVPASEYLALCKTVDWRSH